MTHLDSYLRWFYETLFFLEKLLKPTGSIYIHLDWHVAHYAKVVADEVFGKKNFRDEIYWYYYNKMHDRRKGLFPKATDSILFYVKDVTSDFTFNLLEELREKPVKQLARKKVKGRMVNVKDAQGELVYRDRDKRIIDNVWRISMLQPADKTEKVAFPTQKPEALLQRIIDASSKPGDLMLDCFCGSGTSAVVAETSHLRWIACDLSRFAIHTTRKRLLGVENVTPFVIQNLGKYERQVWQTAEFGNETGARVRSYVSFILKLYSAQALSGHIWLNGRKGNRLVHVGSVDSPISLLDVGQIVAEFKLTSGTGKEAPKTNGIDVLGWDFAFELNELAKQQAAQANVDMRFLRIPREVLDKRAVQQGDVHFFELASLDVAVKTSGKQVTITIKDFVIPADDVPADVQSEIKHWSQWIDYWAIDWNYKKDTFHNEWQEYRTREKPVLATESSKTYDEHGEYRIVVKVIDILGNDTTKILLVKV